MKKLLGFSILISVLLLSGCGERSRDKEYELDSILVNGLSSIESIVTQMEEAGNYDSMYIPYDFMVIRVVHEGRTMYMDEISFLSNNSFSEDLYGFDRNRCVRVEDDLKCEYKTESFVSSVSLDEDVTLANFMSYIDLVNLDDIEEINDLQWSTNLLDEDYKLWLDIEEFNERDLEYIAHTSYKAAYADGEFHLENDFELDGYYLNVTFVSDESDTRITVYYEIDLN